MNDVREASLERDESGLPGGPFAQLLPFLLLLSGAIWLYLNWDGVPPRVPMHWNARGQVDSYVDKRPLLVAMPLVIGGGVCLLLYVMARIIRDASPRGAARKPSLRLMLISEIFVAGICWAVVMISASDGRLLAPGVVFIGALTVVLLGVCIYLYSGMPKTQLRNPEGYRAAGLYYSDPADPALFVPKRSGYGYTINFGHPWGVPVMLGILLLPLAAVLASVLLRR